MIILSHVRSFLGTIIFILYTAICSIWVISLILLRAPKTFVNSEICRWCHGVMRIFNIHVVEVGRDNLDKTTACLYLFNHTSFLDIFALGAKLSGMRFGAKIELFSIPLFGKAMELAGVLPIARSRREQVFAVYERAVERVHRDQQQFALAPEGTRARSERLRPFKSGPFIFALRAGMPLSPVVIQGASSVWPSGTCLPNRNRWRTEIKVIYLPRVSIEGFTIENREVLQRKVFALMQSVMDS